MFTWYGILKVVHVLGTVAWLGGGLALAVIQMQMLRARDRAALAAFVPRAMQYGPSVAGPASGLVLLSGIAMVVIGKLHWPLWTQLGFLGILIHFVFGFVVMRRRLMSFAQAVAAAPAPGDDARIAQAGQSA